MYKFLVFASVLTLAGCTQQSAQQTTQAPAEPRPIQITNNWQTMPTEAYRGKRDDISFVSDTHGWYGTGKGALYATKDGGETWQNIANKPGTFIRALGFLDEQTGFIGNVGTDYYPGVEDETPLYRTDDGGVTWAAVDLGGKTIIDLGGKTIKGVCAIDIVKSERIYQGKMVPRTVIHAAGRVGGPTGILRSDLVSD